MHALPQHSPRSLLSRCRRTLCIAALAACPLAHADNFIDRRANGHPGFFWKHANAVTDTTLILSVAGAAWLGSEDRLGRTLWEGAEGFAVAGVSAEVLKHAFGRERPSQTDDPGRWFKHGHSFPSGHVSTTTAAVTPLLLEYGEEYPAVWLLAALPAYEAVSRVKTRSHWQTDALAGLALGATVGYVEHQHGPWTVRIIPGGAFVGFRKAF